jgi:hypothetical protein
VARNGASHEKMCAAHDETCVARDQRGAHAGGETSTPWIDNWSPEQPASN